MFVLNASICILLFLIGFSLPNLFKKLNKEDKKFLKKLFFYHLAIAVLFHFYIVFAGGDAIHYWFTPKEESFQDILNLAKTGNASGVLYLLNYFPAKILNLSFFTGNMLYALLGYIGFIYFYATGKFLLKNFLGNKPIKLLGISLFPWIFFLPNLHFWSSGIGKDSILFFCIGGFIYALQNINKRYFILLVSLVLSFAVRPHITMFLLVSFSAGYVLDGRLKAYQKFFILLIFIIGLAFTYQYVLQFVQLESFETKTIEEFATTKASKLNKVGSGSGIDISGYPFPVKVFTFLYRPLFFDINGIMAIFASVENLILVLFSILLLRNKPFKAFKKANFIGKGMVVFFLLGTVSFSLILGNLGIMLRQKNMFIPIFLLFGIWAIYLNHKSVYENFTRNK